jgi:hypothetical protein
LQIAELMRQAATSSRAGDGASPDSSAPSPRLQPCLLMTPQNAEGPTNHAGTSGYCCCNGSKSRPKNRTSPKFGFTFALAAIMPRQPFLSEANRNRLLSADRNPRIRASACLRQSRADIFRPRALQGCNPPLGVATVPRRCGRSASSPSSADPAACSYFVLACGRAECYHQAKVTRAPRACR